MHSHCIWGMNIEHGTWISIIIFNTVCSARFVGVGGLTPWCPLVYAPSDLTPWCPLLPPPKSTCTPHWFSQKKSKIHCGPPSGFYPESSTDHMVDNQLSVTGPGSLYFQVFLERRPFTFGINNTGDILSSFNLSLITVEYVNPFFSDDNNDNNDNIIWFDDTVTVTHLAKQLQRITQCHLSAHNILHTSSCLGRWTDLLFHIYTS